MTLGRRRFLGVAGLAAAVGAVRASFGGILGRTRAAAGEGAQSVRWAMVVDPERCREAGSCTDCISACHRRHNVPAVPDARHEVKWIWKAPFETVFAAESAHAPAVLRATPVPLLCNHCENPPCVRVCPVKATWRREDGVVMMDWHRCIGCRYCVAACPYGARSFNWVDPRPHLQRLDPGFPTRTKGVVEKCNFCEERLAAGQPPACVEACREKALVFGDLNDPASGVRRLLDARYSIRRRPELGTEPRVFYLV